MITNKRFTVLDNIIMTPNENIQIMRIDDRENQVFPRKSFTHLIKNIYNNNFNYNNHKSNRGSRNNNLNDYDYNLNDYDYNSDYDDEHIDGPICSHESIIQRVKRRFNLLDYDIKHLVAYAESLLCTVRNHEQTIYRMNGDLNLAQDRVYNLQERAKIAEKRVAEIAPPETICCICMDAPREMVYINCGHLCACVKCEQRIGDKCPICRTASRAVKIIYS